MSRPRRRVWVALPCLSCAGPAAPAKPTAAPSSGPSAGRESFVEDPGVSASPTVAPARFEVFGNLSATCVAPLDGPVRCLGYNGESQLRSEGLRLEEFVASDRFTPEDRDRHLGNSHACAVDPKGQVRCWGSSLWGKRGDGCNLGRDGIESCDGTAMDPARSNQTVTQLESLPPIAALAGGWDHTCARSESGEVWCWGANIDHEIAREDGDFYARPERVDLPKATQLAAGAHHNCILDEAGAIWCWGHASIAGRESGTGDMFPPERIPDAPAGRLSMTPWGGCSADTEGRAACWGEPNIDEGGAFAVQEGWKLRGLDRMVGANDYSCGLATDGQIHCYGTDVLYIDGGVSEDDFEWGSPKLPFADPVVGLVGLHSAACAWNARGQLACWGEWLPGRDEDDALPKGVSLVDYAVVEPEDPAD